MAPYAVTKIDAGQSTEHYRVLVKHTDTFSWDENNDGVIQQSEYSVNENWELFKVSTAGVMDWSSNIWTDSITSWEDEFGMDINGDGDASGSVVITARTTDTSTDSVTLGNDFDGALWITDGSTTIQINDNWIEQENYWGDGGFSATAIAVTKNNNDTASDTSDDYYQLAVKQSNTWTDWYTGEQSTNEDWQIYAVNTSGNIDWSKTFFTQSIKNFEDAFGQDLDGDG